ncbi:MAG: sulfatase [Bacteroidota bacterium]
MKYLAFFLLFAWSSFIFPPEKQPNILFLIADDWSYPHASIYGDPVVQTPTFDFLASEGAVFQNAYCASPSCSPSRAAILTGRYPHQNESVGNLWSVFPGHLPNYVRTLGQNGYFTGKARKGWGPGDHEAGGYEHNPAGEHFDSFKAFLKARPKNQPFCYWFGSQDPHRKYTTNTGTLVGMNRDAVKVPGFFPDTECVRNDILDYYFEVERFDRECGHIIRQLEENGELDNTIIVMTSDNGMPFPRAKANLYDYGTRMPLAVYWKGEVKAGTTIEAFVNSIDLAPSFLEAAGIEVPKNMSGQPIWSLLRGEKEDTDRSKIFLERERHANARKGDLSYPMRAVRTHNYLYIRNFEPNRYPAGDPEVHQSVGQYGDVDNSITKFEILDREGKKGAVDYFQLAFGKRPAEELYNVKTDPFQLTNLAGEESLQDTLAHYQQLLNDFMIETNDLRATQPNTIYWDTVRYTPTYQRRNFDLQKGIDDYFMLSTSSGRRDTTWCE